MCMCMLARDSCVVGAEAARVLYKLYLLCCKNHSPLALLSSPFKVAVYHFMYGPQPTREYFYFTLLPEHTHSTQSTQ